MEKTQINFKQERDFGEIFNATFAFIGQEIKLLGKALLYFVVPVLLIASIFMVLMGMEQQKMMRGISNGDPSSLGNPFAAFGDMFFYIIIAMLVYAVAFTMIKCTVYGYIKIYIEKGKGEFELNDIWNEIKRNFFPVLGTSIVVGLIVGLGFVFCLIPGIYFGVSLSLIYIILIFEGNGFGNAFSRSFEIVKQKWWLTLGLIIVVYLMIYVISMLFSIPGMIVGLKPLFMNLKNLENLDNMEPFAFSTGYYIFNAITYLVMYILMAIPALVLSFHYFSLVEMKDKPSLEEKINQIETNE